ncbi:MAG: aminotransferase class III-fold pyridoxal phosphate-dependent enzyme [Vicinamibacterales bacterium]
MPRLHLGIGVSVLGHGHPALARAIAEQAAALLHTSNLYYHPLQWQVASRLAALSGLQRVFFCNSGTEAMEACLKFARRRHWHAGRARPHALRRLRARLLGPLDGIPVGDGERALPRAVRAPHPRGHVRGAGRRPALEAAVTSETAAIVVEPIQGEGGVRPIPAAMVAAIEAACARTGTLLIADEIQCGLGRTGSAFHFQAVGLTPDLVTVGKALGGGVPVGAALVSEAVAANVMPGDHGTTYGGNLLATRAALVVLEELMDRGLLAHVREVGAHFGAALDRLAAKHAVVREVRGAGVMRGVELTVDAAPVVDGARARGLLVNRTDERVVRLLPPFTVSAAEVDEAVATLDAVLAGLPAEATTR